MKKNEKLRKLGMIGKIGKKNKHEIQERKGIQEKQGNMKVENTWKYSEHQENI